MGITRIRPPPGAGTGKEVVTKGLAEHEDLISNLRANVASKSTAPRGTPGHAKLKEPRDRVHARLLAKEQAKRAVGVEAAKSDAASAPAEEAADRADQADQAGLPVVDGKLNGASAQGETGHTIAI